MVMFLAGILRTYNRTLKFWQIKPFRTFTQTTKSSTWAYFIGTSHDMLYFKLHIEHKKQNTEQKQNRKSGSPKRLGVQWNDGDQIFVAE